MRLNSFLDSHTIKIRKHWLRASLVNFVIAPILVSLILMYLYHRANLPQDELFKIIFEYYGMAFISFPIVWYFAYHRQGYGYLTLALILGGMRTFQETITQLKNCSDPWSLSILCIASITYTWWFIISVQLRSVNKQIEGLKKESKEYLQSIYSLRSARDTQFLDKTFGEISDKWPKYSSATLRCVA